MTMKFAEKIITEIEKRGSIQIPDGYVTGEEFESYLRRRKIKVPKPEIIEDYKGIFSMLQKED